MRAHRLIDLVENLRGRSVPVTAEVLAQRFSVSVRTIYRDISALQSMGAPIRGAGGYGYCLEDGYFLPPLAFDDDEYEALGLALGLLAVRADEDLAASGRRALKKIEAMQRNALASGYGRALLVAPTPDAPASPLALCRGAIRSRTVLRLQYRALDEKETNRDIWPLGITFFETSVLLTAWCEDRSDFRNFRMDRILSACLLDRKFRAERGRRLEDYLRTLV